MSLGVCAALLLTLAAEPSGPAAPEPEAALDRAAAAADVAGLAPHWNPRWRGFEAVDWAVSGGLLAASITGGLLVTPPRVERWRGGILFDDDVRRWLRGGETARKVAGTVSDISVSTLALAPFAFALLAPDADLAWKLVLIDAEALLLQTALVVWTKDIAGRTRPDADCGPGCGGSRRAASFYSGHASLAFTGAGLLCVQGRVLPGLLGPEASDWACAAAMTAAAATGVLRLVADVHYASDVIVGTAVGLFSGALMPLWWHFSERADAQARWRLAPTPLAATDGSLGFGLSLSLRP